MKWTFSFHQKYIQGRLLKGSCEFCENMKENIELGNYHAMAFGGFF